jgi:UDP-N-acetylglucosamine--N-acetylmuramyl-(pentapeptide) pyrophosphoryl-undecaprenol N-acetylglucosamine transferase
MAGRHRRPHLSRAWPWPRPCANAAGACTGWAASPAPQHGKPAGAAAGLCASRRWISPACAARARSRWPCCRCAAARVLAEHPGRAPRQARRGGGPGRLHHLSGGMMAVLLGKPLVLHEQNSVAGMANRCWPAWPTGCSPPSRRCWPRHAGSATRCARPSSAQPAPEPSGLPGAAAAAVLVVGGSLGAKALNDTMPQALALMPAAQRPQVLHQSGATDRRTARQLRRRRRAGRADALHRRHRQRLRRCRPGDLPRRRQHRDRTRRGRRGRAVRAVSVAVDDHQTATRASWSTRAPAGWCRRRTHTRRAGADAAAGHARGQNCCDAPTARGAAKTEARCGAGSVTSACEELAGDMKHAIKHIHFVGIGGSGMSASPRCC